MRSASTHRLAETMTKAASSKTPHLGDTIFGVSPRKALNERGNTAYLESKIKSVLARNLLFKPIVRLLCALQPNRPHMD